MGGMWRKTDGEFKEPWPRDLGTGLSARAHVEGRAVHKGKSVT